MNPYLVLMAVIVALTLLVLWMCRPRGRLVIRFAEEPTTMRWLSNAMDMGIQVTLQDTTLRSVVGRIVSLSRPRIKGVPSEPSARALTALVTIINQDNEPVLIMVKLLPRDGLPSVGEIEGWVGLRGGVVSGLR